MVEQMLSQVVEPVSEERLGAPTVLLDGDGHFLNAPQPYPQGPHQSQRQHPDELLEPIRFRQMRRLQIESAALEGGEHRLHRPALPVERPRLGPAERS